MTPNNPSAEAKISMTKILTKVLESYVSAKAQAWPAIPTQTPHIKLLKPIIIPFQNMIKLAYNICL